MTSPDGAKALHSERLDLIALAPQVAIALVEGVRLDGWAADFPQDGDMVIARLLNDHPPTSADQVSFGPRHLILRETGLVVGTAGFFGPPDEHGAVGLGYGVVPSVRDQGLATEALRALLDFAASDPRVALVKADASLENTASRRVLDNGGMAQVSTDDALAYYEWTPPRV